MILGLLSGLVGPRLLGHLDSSKVTAASLQIDEFGAALDMYRLEVGSYPKSEHSLAALIEKPADVSGWNGPYLKKKLSGQIPGKPVSL
ncbi:type II secretion system protein GspG [Aliamphritea spongicola]|nr:type II secretion system protein GspG [Aliamphritea spongicola]